MARLFHEVKAYGIKPVLVAGSFQPNGVGAVDQTTISGRGVASVARTGVGTFLVTLEDGFVGELAWISGGVIQDAAADFTVHQRGAATTGTTAPCTFTVALQTGAADADWAAGAANRVCFAVMFEESGS